MTYVVGMKIGPTVTILTDTRVTQLGKGHNTANKSGILFPGCIFAIVGSYHNAKDFLLEARGNIPGNRSIEDNWNTLVHIASGYTFPQNEAAQFQVLFSTRASGSAKMWLLDSSSGLEPIADNIELVTLGSGKDILDEFVESLQLRNHFVSASKQKFIIGPYFLCLKLVEKTQSLERSRLEEIGVGGIFHFIYQMSSKEGRQAPAVYVLCDFDDSRKLAYGWMYRVAYVEDSLGVALVVESLTPPGQVTIDCVGYKEQQATYDMVSSAGVKDINDPAVKERIQSLIDIQPFYFFCGFGALDPYRRQGAAYHATNQEDWLVQKDGTCDHFAISQILEHFAS